MDANWIILGADIFEWIQVSGAGWSQNAYALRIEYKISILYSLSEHLRFKIRLELNLDTLWDTVTLADKEHDLSMIF